MASRNSSLLNVSVTSLSISSQDPPHPEGVVSPSPDLRRPGTVRLRVTRRLRTAPVSAVVGRDPVWTHLPTGGALPENCRTNCVTTGAAPAPGLISYPRDLATNGQGHAVLHIHICDNCKSSLGISSSLTCVTYVIGGVTCGHVN